MANELKRSKRIVFDKKYEKDINKNSLDLLEKYRTAMFIKGLAKSSIYNYTRDLIQWLSYIQFKQFGLMIKDVTVEDIEQFIFYCNQEGNNIERIKRRLSSVSTFYDFLRKKRILKENPCDFIDRPKKGLPVVVQTFLTFEQYDLMKQKLIECGNIQLRTYAILSVDTMVRVEPVTKLQWSQVNFDQRVINDVLEKEGKIVTLYFGEETKKLLLDLKKYREENDIDDNGYLFVTKKNGKHSQVSSNTLRAWTTTIGNMIDVPTLHPHDYRHSGSDMRKLKGMGVSDISSLLGHENIDTTKKYYLKEDTAHVRKIVDNFTI